RHGPPCNWRFVMPILRTAAVVQRTGLSRTTLWRLERAGDFPSRIRLGVNSVGWNSDEIEAWIERRPRRATNVAAALDDRHSQRGFNMGTERRGPAWQDGAEKKIPERAS